jgi:hypothetical protein
LGLSRFAIHSRKQGQALRDPTVAALPLASSRPACGS